MDFTFVVITYNHEAYVLEHLESIAYQIREYGQRQSFQLIVADDGSTDQTLAFVRHWIERNSSLFVDVQIHTQAANHGTCHNYTKVWPYVQGNLCKFTAGDDVYSCENLLAEWQRLQGYDMSSGYPLHLIEGRLTWPAFFNVNMVASNRIFGRANYMKRLLSVSFNHTPSIIFSTRVLRDDVVRDFVLQFAVTEDYPMHVKMAERFFPLSFAQSPLVHVYYRRTSGSTYLVRNAAFVKDKLEIFSYLKCYVASGFEKILLINRIYCFQQNTWRKRLLNLNYIVYGARFAANFFGVIRDYMRIKPELDKHRIHYNNIRRRAEEERDIFMHS